MTEKTTEIQGISTKKWVTENLETVMVCHKIPPSCSNRTTQTATMKHSVGLELKLSCGRLKIRPRGIEEVA